MELKTGFKIQVPESIYIRDPEKTQLGRKIIKHSIKLIEKLGFEAFTFKKLAKEISSTETSIYRYFDNKHNLLVYLMSWYWNWLAYLIDYYTEGIEDIKTKLKTTIKIIGENTQKKDTFSFINEKSLQKVVIAESSKAYYTKSVDNENKDGFFIPYKALCKKVADIMKVYNPDYKFHHALTSTILEVAHQQVYFSQHLPSLTEIEKNDFEGIIAYLENLVFVQLEK